MKSRVLMATLVVTLLMGARIYACDACDPASCDPCTSCSKSCDLFSGLKKLVSVRPSCTTDCGPCDGVVACSPCDDACNPCDDAGCDTGCGRKFVFGKRLRGFFACTNSCGPCDADCGPCDNSCGPCDDLCGPCDTGCDVGCGPCFSFKKFFKGFRFAGRCGDGCCDPCAADCGPCDNSCGPCDANCGACDDACNPCDGCGTGCGFKFGRIFDKPRRNIKKFFDGCFVGRCNPCDAACGACDVACGCGYSAPAASALPEAAN